MPGNQVIIYIFDIKCSEMDIRDGEMITIDDIRLEWDTNKEVQNK